MGLGEDLRRLAIGIYLVVESLSFSPLLLLEALLFLLLLLLEVSEPTAGI